MNLIVNIRKKLRDFYLDVNFKVIDEVFALLGASGCGKSMTLKCIAGIETPDEGKIILNDRILFDSDQKINLSPQDRHVGYLFQNYALFPNMTVAENILFSAVGDTDEKNLALKKNLERFKLNGLENSYPSKLSGGQQQRVAFARILASNAEILLLDEPFSALDNYLKWQLELEISSLLKFYDNAAILVSHDRGEAFRLSDRIAVMNHGLIDTINSKDQLFKNPQTLSTAKITGCQNISAAHIENDFIIAEDWKIKLPITNYPLQIKYLAVRANDLEYRTSEGKNIFLMKVDQAIEDINCFVVMLRHKENHSELKLIRWEVDKKIWRKIQAEEIYLYFPPEKLIFLEN
ncbi:MAG: ATP-binding cassette domain-containing protein [Selenomonadaceae bacterium]|nr:ATP-binding cassette domain-containing protein [Selenomonadaceae bacterium]